MMAHLRFRQVLGSVSLLLLTVVAQPAAAQTTSAAQPAQAPAADYQLEEIVITAQKRTEKLEDVPVAANVIGSSVLAQSNAGSISDLNKLVPSVEMTVPVNSAGALGIRGISSVANQGTVGLNSGVALLLDGIPVPSDSFAANQLEDVQRVEVLKGPQSTLGGRAAAQGMVNIVTKAPSDVWTGSLSGTATNDDERRINGFLSGPIVGTVLDFSLSAYDNSRYYPITNTLDGEKMQERTSGVHGKLYFAPTEDLDITLATAFTSNRVLGNNLTYAYITPGATMLGIPGFLGQAQLLPEITPSLGNQFFNSPVTTAAFSANDAMGSLNIDYHLGDYILSSTTAYQTDRQATINDLFVVSQYFFNVLTHGSATFSNTQNLWRHDSQTSEELKLASPVDRAISYIVGAFYSDAPVTSTQIRNFVGSPINYTVSAESVTYDLYGRSTWKITSADSLITGLRYNYDRVSYSMDQIKNGTEGAFSSSGDSDLSTVVGDVTLQHHLPGNSMIYATYSRGYAPQAYNTTATLTSNTPLSPVAKENINNFEIGTKNAFFDRRLIVNADVFDTI
jgi:iron complex outermembrane recepter protein